MLKDDILNEAKIIVEGYSSLPKNSIKRTRTVHRLEMLKDLAKKYYNDKILVERIEGAFILIGENRPPYVSKVVSGFPDWIKITPLWHFVPFIIIRKNPFQRFIDKLIRKLIQWS